MLMFSQYVSTLTQKTVILDYRLIIITYDRKREDPEIHILNFLLVCVCLFGISNGVYIYIYTYLHLDIHIIVASSLDI